MANFYPLAANNQWQYKLKDGRTYTNKVTATNGNEFSMHNSVTNTNCIVKTDGNNITMDGLEAGNFQKWLANDMQQGDTWEINFKANGLDCILVMTVKETGGNKEVEGKTYNNVMMIEAESKIIMNGNLMPLNFFTQYFYAEGTGLVLTTTSAGDSHTLVDCTLN